MTKNNQPRRWIVTWRYAKSHAVAAVAGAWLYASFDRFMELAGQLISM